MPRYIDADELKKWILKDMADAEREGKDLAGYQDALFRLKTAPDADEAKKAFAREIFAEIESHFAILAYPVITALGTVGTENADGWHLDGDDYNHIKAMFTNDSL